MSRKEILTGAGTISAKVAQQHALSEFEKYRVRQDKLYQSDFDRMLLETDEVQKLPDRKLTAEIIDVSAEEDGE